MATKSENAMNSLVNGLVQYIDNKVNAIPYVKTDIGVIKSVSLNSTTNKYLHTVTVRDFDYTEIKSLGNCEFNVGSVVYILVPNGQYNNMFILGHLDDTNANIKGGTINIGNGKFTVDNLGNMISTSGKIANFNIANNNLSYNDIINNRSFLLAPGTEGSCIVIRGYSIPLWIYQTENNVNQITIVKPRNNDLSVENFQYWLNIGSNQLGFHSYYQHQPEWGTTLKHKKYLTFHVDDNTSHFIGFRENLDADGTHIKGGYLESNQLVLFEDVNNATQSSISINPTEITANKATLRINKIYCNDPPLSPSDRNKKKYIKSLNSKLKDFIMNLNPVSYKFKNDESNKTHYGLIAQDVEKTMDEMKLSVSDFALISKDQKIKRYEEKIIEEDSKSFNGTVFKTQNEKIIPKEEIIDGEYEYSLSYQELIAPMIKTIQLQQKEIDELRQRIEKLEKGE